MVKQLLFALPVLASATFNNSKCPAPHELQAEGLAQRFDLHGNYPGMYYELAFHDILQWVCPAVTCVNSNKSIATYPDGQEYVHEPWGMKCLGKDYPQVLENNVTDIPGHFEAFVPASKVPGVPEDLLKDVLFPNTIIDFVPGDQGWTLEFQCVDLPVLGVVYIGWVQKAFQILDKDGSGVVTMDDIASSYDVSQNPAVKSGKQSPNEAYTVFMNNYDANQDGKVTLDEFIENYNWVSASIDNDDYFELMIRNAWHISGGEGWCQNTANLRVLVEHFDGGQEVVEIIDDLGLDKRDYSAVMRKLTAQGVKDIKGFKLAS